MADGAAAANKGAVPGHDAQSPWAMPRAAWKQVLGRAYSESSEDNIGLISAGVAFYGFLAIVPLLLALVLLYGLVADPQDVVQQIQKLASMMPADAAKLVGGQLLNIVQTSGGKKGLGLAIALLGALYSASSGASAVTVALNVAYEEDEQRSFIKQYLVSLAMVLVSLVVAIVAIAAIGILSSLEKLIPQGGALVVLGKIASYLLLGVVGAIGAGALYRWGPNRERPRWTWIAPGSIFTGLFWLILTVGFGFYVSNFGSYNATYGSLGAVIVLLTWLYLSAYVLLMGAEINSEFERQTRHDSTTGAEQPMGTRGAVVADQFVGSGQADQTEPVRDGRPIPPSHALVPAAPSIRRSLTELWKTGGMSVLVTTAGLSALRRKGQTGMGLALVALGTAWTWFGRHPASEREVRDARGDLTLEPLEREPRSALKT